MYCRSVLMWHFSRDVNKTAEFLLYINSQVQSEPNCCEQTDLTPSFCKHTRQVSRVCLRNCETRSLLSRKTWWSLVFVFPWKINKEKERQGVSKLLFLGVLIPFSWWERKAICFVWGFDPVSHFKAAARSCVSYPLLFIVASSRLSLGMFSGLQSCSDALFGFRCRVRIGNITPLQIAFDYKIYQ